MPEISVIVPVYRVEKYIRRCVDSILAQTYKDFELILIDDGSPDQCPEICDEYAEMDPRVRVIHQKNCGQAAARNRGVACAAGEWVHFVDSDDMIHPQMLEILYRAAQENNVKISACGAIEAGEVPDDFAQRKKYPLFSYRKVDEELLIELGNTFYYHCVWGKLIHRGLVEQFPFTEGRFYEDIAVVCWWLKESGSVCMTSEALYFYFVNMEGTTKGQKNLKKLDDNLWTYEEQLKFASYLLKEFGYERFYSFIATKYIRNLCCVYFDLRSIDINKAKIVRQNGKKFYRKNKKIIMLDPKETKWAHEMFYPLLMKVYWWIKARIEK